MADRPMLFLFFAGLSGRSLQRLAVSGQLASRLSGHVSASLRFPLGDQPAATLNSVATGFWPDQHGVLQPVLREGGDGSFHTATANDRRAPALWERMALEGAPAIAVGWPQSLPANAGPSLQVVDAAFGAGDVCLPSAVFPNTVAGDQTADLLEAWLQPHELPLEVVAALTPKVDGNDALGLRGRLAAGLAETISRHAAFLELITTAPWRLASLCLDLSWTGELALGDAPHPAEQLLIDLVLAVLAQAPADANLVIGAMPLRPKGGPGGVIFQGPSFFPMAEALSASVLDLVPTLAALAGFADARLPGRVLMEILRPEVLTRSRRFQAAWAPPKGPAPMSAEIACLDLLNPPGLDARAVVTFEELRQWQREWNLTLFRSLVARSAFLEALPLVEQRVRDVPDEPDAMLVLAELLLRAGLWAEALEAAEDAMALTPPENPDAALLAAAALAASGQRAEAQARLSEVADTLPGVTDPARLLNVYEYLDDWDSVLEVVAAHAARMPEERRQLATARARLALGDPAAARDAALSAVTLNYANPLSHDLLGRALWALGERSAAMTAFATCSCLAPHRAWPCHRLADHGAGAGYGREDIEQWQMQAALAEQDEARLIEQYRESVAAYRREKPAIAPKAPVSAVADWGAARQVVGVTGLPGAGQASLLSQLSLHGLNLADTAPEQWRDYIGLGEPRLFEEGLAYDIPCVVVACLPRQHRYRVVLCQLEPEDITVDYIRRYLPPVFGQLEPEEVQAFLLRQQYYLRQTLESAPNIEFIEVAHSTLANAFVMPPDLLAFLTLNARGRGG